ncbi:hypothetical protein, partial [Streptomyces sp. IBSBF 2806]|uniref:hypothetical protein n=1 Tax=Streptomyces sp. IBSBF 2806 TaxID=2903529 RepID=UPI003FA7537F
MGSVGSQRIAGVHGEGIGEDGPGRGALAVGGTRGYQGAAGGVGGRGAARTGVGLALRVHRARYRPALRDSRALGDPHPRALRALGVVRVGCVLDAARLRGSRRAAQLLVAVAVAVVVD